MGSSVVGGVAEMAEPSAYIFYKVGVIFLQRMSEEKVWTLSYGERPIFQRENLSGEYTLLHQFLFQYYFYKMGCGCGWRLCSG